MDLLQSQIMNRVNTIKGGQTEDEETHKKAKIKPMNKFDEAGSDENESDSGSSSEAD